MGQSFTAVLFSNNNNNNELTKQMFHPHKYENGYKLTESCYFGNFFLETVAKEITEKPKRVWWIGGYSERKDFKRKLDKEAFNYYKKDLDDYYTNQPQEPEQEMPESKGYLVNYDKQVYIDLNMYKQTAPTADKNDPEWEVKIHPLSILTAVGNDRGGGDYYGINMKLVGSWAGDLLEITEKSPDANFKDITFEVRFQEDYEAYTKEINGGKENESNSRN